MALDSVAKVGYTGVNVRFQGGGNVGKGKPGPLDLTNVWTSKDLAEAEQLNPSRVRQLCLEGRFPNAFKVGKTWVIPDQDVQTWREKHRDRRYSHWKGDVNS